MSGLGLGLGFSHEILPDTFGPWVPTVSGVPYVGYTLTCIGGTFASYQWRRNGIDIGGAVASTYLMTVADEGLPITCFADGVLSNAVRGWVPTDEPSIQYWFDAFNTPSISLTGTAVTAWADRAGGPITPAQATAAKQPVYDAVGFGGYPTVTFDGVDDGLRYYDAAGIPNIVVNQPSISFHGIFDVADVASAGRQSLHAVSTSVGTGQGVQAQTVFNGPAVNAWEIRGRRVSTDTLTATPTNSPLANGPQIVGTVYDAFIASGFTVVNGVESAPVAWQAAGLFGPTLSKAVSVGSHTGANADYFNGKISEVFFFNVAPTPTDSVKVQGYLAWRWRRTALLPSNHPYKNIYPV